MILEGNLGGHIGSVSSEFVTTWVAPWVKAHSWTPPPVASERVASLGPAPTD